MIAVPLWLGVLLIVALLVAYGLLLARRKQRKAEAASFSANPVLGVSFALGAMTWRQFELLVGQAFRSRGYVVGESGSSAADGAVDLVLRKSGEYFLVQCKHWRLAQVDIATVRELHHAMRAHHAAGGFVITTGGFTREAMAFASGRKIQLIDGPTLREMLNDSEGVATGVPTVPTVGSEGKPTAVPAAPLCPECHGAMVFTRPAPGASGAQSKNVWCCARYPLCRGSREVA